MKLENYLTTFQKKVEGDFDRATALSKFQIIIFVQRGSTLDQGARPYQDADALTQLRNGLVHFKPQWDGTKSQHKRISDTLNGRFAPSPFISGPEGLFPRRWATHGCTRWAVQTCFEFAEEFEKRAGLPAKFGPQLHHVSP